MTNNVYTIPFFDSKYKRLRKKFPSLESELTELNSDLKTNPRIGEPLGSSLYKIRLASKDKSKGKSGGFRVITYLIKEQTNSLSIYLITIFDKSEESSVSKVDLQKIVKAVFG